MPALIVFFWLSCYFKFIFCIGYLVTLNSYSVLLSYYFEFIFCVVGCNVESVIHKLELIRS